MAESSQCPYCRKQLESKPTRKKPCPHCGQTIVVLKGHLLTVEQKEIEEWLQRLNRYGVTEQAFRLCQEELGVRFGAQASIRDTVWALYNSCMSQGADHQQLRMLYADMAAFVREDGKDPTPLLAESARHSLLEIQGIRLFKHVRIMTCNDGCVCSGCRSAAEKVWTIEEALKEMPIPYACKSPTGCRCWYNATLE